MELLNLNKGAVLNLTKEAPELRKMMIGLGWDTRMDLDAIAYLADANGVIKETVYFGSKNHQGIFLNGDNLTGAGDGDDECIFVNFNELPKWVTNIKVCVNIFMGGGLFGIGKKDFSAVKGAFVRLVNDENDREICRYNLTEDGKGFNGFHFADLNKSSDETWDFIAVGEGLNGSVEKIREKLSK